MWQRASRGYTTFISTLLIIIFTCFSTSPVSLGISWSDVMDSHLAQPNPSNPIVYPEIADKAHLGSMVLAKLRQDPAVLSFGKDATANMFLQLPSEETIKIFFSKTEDLLPRPELAGNIKSILVIPVSCDGRYYFVYIVIDKDGQGKSNVYSKEDFIKHYGTLGTSEETAMRLIEATEDSSATSRRGAWFIDSADKSVRAVSAFLLKIGAVNINTWFQGIVKERMLVLSGETGEIVVREADSPEARAQSILEEVFVKNGAARNSFTQAFKSFWDLWKQNKTDDFDLNNMAPALMLLVSQIERGPKGVANEGTIVFWDETYRYILADILAVLSNYEDALKDIKDAWHKVALHEIRAHNTRALESRKKAAARIIGIAKLGQQGLSETVVDTLKRGGYGTIQKIASANPEALAGLDGYIGEAIKPIMGDEIFNVPGMDPDRIIVSHLTNGVIPTEMAGNLRTGGNVELNENYVRMVQLMRDRGFDGQFAVLRRGFPNETTIYKAAIFSRAIHTIRAHFPINDQGFVEFRDSREDEIFAQGERGDKYLFVNLMGTYLEWMHFIELYNTPARRVRFFMGHYSYMFRKLEQRSPELVTAFPDIFKTISDQLVTNNLLSREGPKVRPTGEDKDTVLRFMSQRGVVFNEGANFSGRDEEEPAASGEEGSSAIELAQKILAICSDAAHESARLAGRIDPKTGNSMPGMDDLNMHLSLIRLLDDNVIETLETAGYSTAYDVLNAGVDGLSAVLDVLSPDEVKWLTQDQLRRIREGLSAKADINSKIGEVYEVIEPKWADAFLASVVDSPKAREIKSRGEKLVLALETDWVPDLPKQLVQRLIQKIRELEEKGVIEVVEGDKDTLAANLAKKIEGRNVPSQNIVVLAGKDTIQDAGFNAIKGRATLVGVDASNLNDSSYIRYLEMLTMAVRISLGQTPFSHSKIAVTLQDDGTFLFLPAPEKIDYRYMQNVINAQIKILHSA